MTDGSQGFIYVLFEHKSYYDRFVHLQLLEYMVKLSSMKKNRSVFPL